jgi:hypothetical protein
LFFYETTLFIVNTVLLVRLTNDDITLILDIVDFASLMPEISFATVFPGHETVTKIGRVLQRPCHSIILRIDYLFALRFFFVLPTMESSAGHLYRVKRHTQRTGSPAVSLSLTGKRCGQEKPGRRTPARSTIPSRQRPARSYMERLERPSSSLGTASGYCQTGICADRFCSAGSLRIGAAATPPTCSYTPAGQNGNAGSPYSARTRGHKFQD